MSEIKPVRGGIHSFFLTAVLAVMILFFVVGTRWESRQREPLVYRESLDMEAVTVNRIPLTLRELAFYTAYEEMEVEKQAVIYDSKHPAHYWNTNLGGTYVRVAARNAAMQMAVHDEIFYQMAVQDGMELSNREQEYLNRAEQDFWSDLTEYGGDKRMGISEKTIKETMQKITLAEKYQKIYSAMNNCDEKEYDFTGTAYKKLLDEQEVEIHEKVWKRVSFGSVSLKH